MRRRIPKKKSAGTSVTEDFGTAVFMKTLGFPFYRVFELSDGRIAFEFWGTYEMPQVAAGDFGERLESAATYLRKEIELFNRKKPGNKE